MKNVIGAVNEFKGVFPSAKNTSGGWYINQVGDLGFYNCQVSSHEEFNQCVEDCSNNKGWENTMNKIDWSLAPEWAISYASHSTWLYWVGDKGYSTTTSPSSFYEFGSYDSSTEYYIKGDFEIIESRTPVPCEGKIPKPVYTQAMQDAGEEPTKGMLVNLVFIGNSTSEEVEIIVVTDDYIIAKPGIMEQHYHRSNYSIQPIDTRTDREKSLDSLMDAYWDDNNEKLSRHSPIVITIYNAIKAGKIHGVTFTGSK